MKETVIFFLGVLGVLSVSAAATALLLYAATWVGTLYAWILQYSPFWAGTFVLAVLLIVIALFITLIFAPWRN